MFTGDELDFIEECLPLLDEFSTDREREMAPRVFGKILNAKMGNHGWIPVADQLPESGKRVLGGDEKGVYICYYHEDGKWVIGSLDCWANPTHWQPLPKPPEET